MIKLSQADSVTTATSQVVVATHVGRAPADTHVVPESPKGPTDSSATACTDSAVGRISTTQPLMNRQSTPISIEGVTSLVVADDPCPVATNPSQPTAATSNIGVLSNEDTPTQPQHLKSYTVPSSVEAVKQHQDTRCEAAVFQPAEFDIVVDAHPTGKLTQ